MSTTSKVQIYRIQDVNNKALWQSKLADALTEGQRIITAQLNGNTEYVTSKIGEDWQGPIELIAVIDSAP